MLDRVLGTRRRLRVARPSALPVADMVIGQDAVEAAALLPRLFNLCRVAQGVAARAAFGLPQAAGDGEAIREEILREHLLKICLKLPGHFGLGASPLPQGWQKGAGTARKSLFGAPGVLPETPTDFDNFMNAGTASAVVLRHIRDCFGPGEATSLKLPLVTQDSVFEPGATENSVAARQAQGGVMRHIEQIYGRGPFWRATARLYDAQDCMDGRLPAVVMPQPGRAVVPAARGSFAIAAAVSDGKVTAFRRVTPTDHLLASGGILERTLASLPSEKIGMAPLLLDILDPCVSLKLSEAKDA